MLLGERQAWGILAELDPQDVCGRAKVAFDNTSGVYTFESFAQEISVSIADELVFSHSPIGDLLLNDLGNYSRLSILSYLIHAKDIPSSDELINPANLPGGQIYSQGTHKLPLDKITERYENDIEGLLNRGRGLGGEMLKYGDASVGLAPFPRVPVVIILWKKVEEFPARSDLLLYATCKFHLPPDILWSTAMMSVEIMLRD